MTRRFWWPLIGSSDRRGRNTRLDWNSALFRSFQHPSSRKLAAPANKPSSVVSWSAVSSCRWARAMRTKPDAWLGKAGMANMVYAAVVTIARRHNAVILTGDFDGIQRLATAAGGEVTVVAV